MIGHDEHDAVGEMFARVASEPVTNTRPALAEALNRLQDVRTLLLSVYGLALDRAVSAWLAKVQGWLEQTIDDCVFGSDGKAP